MMTILRRLLIMLMVLTLAGTSVACGSASGDNELPNTGAQQTDVRSPQNRLGNGQYPVQQATYNDVDGEYTVMVLNTAPGDSAVYRTDNLPMARLTEEEVKQGEKSYLKVENGQPSLHLTEDFKIEYVHNVTETKTDPQTGQQETVVIRQQSGFWSPFAGALAGQALGSLLFRPQYYMPPVYQPGLMTGYGGYGGTYNQAVSSYRQRYNAPPNVVKNQQSFRTTGRLRTTSGQVRTTPARSQNRATGSGYGSNTLKRSPSSGSTKSRPRSNSFGSSRSRSFGGRRR